jgi:hypothetical protein
MTSKKIVMFLSIVCVFTLMFSISSTLVYGGNDNGSQNYKVDGTWVQHSFNFGSVSNEVATSNGNASGRSFSGTFSFPVADGTLGGLYPDVAPVGTPGIVKGHMTGRDTYEFSALKYVKNNDGTIAYFWIGRGIGKFLDENTIAQSTLIYFYNGEKTNLFLMPPNMGPDGMPLDETDLLFGGPLPDLAIKQRLNSAIPSLDPPADHFPLP